jgi:hypothetical protein
MKKITLLARIFPIALIALLAANVQYANAGTLAQLAVVDHVTVQNVGDPATVNITLVPPAGGNITNLKGVQIKLSWNTTILDCTGAQLLPGNPFEGLSIQNPAASIDHTAGTATYMCMGTTTTDYVNVTTTKPLCKFTFNSLARGVSNITFLNVNVTGGTYLINSTGLKIPIESLPGDVTVLPEFAVLLLLPAFVAVAAVTVAMKRKQWNT